MDQNLMYDLHIVGAFVTLAVCMNDDDNIM
jgi:hypothetical protein